MFSALARSLAHDFWQMCLACLAGAAEVLATRVGVRVVHIRVDAVHNWDAIEARHSAYEGLFLIVVLFKFLDLVRRFLTE